MGVFDNVEEELREVLPQFFNNLKDNMEELKQQIKEENISEIRRIAHGIKGSAGSFGLSEINDLARELEQTAAEFTEDYVGNSSAQQAIQKRFSLLKEKIEKTVKALEEIQD